MPDSVDLKSIIKEIVNLNEHIREFWSNAQGWAPVEAALQLSRSRLDWQVSLSLTLQLWITPPEDTQRDGQLILAWANLGSLVEGTLKLLLCVHYRDYQADAHAKR